ncbi:MAG: hypothetical protein ACOC22_03335 [bacterium]
MGAFDEENMVAKTAEKRIEFLKKNIVSQMMTDDADYSSALDNIKNSITHDNLLVAWLPIIRYNGIVHTADVELTSDEIKAELDTGSIVIIYAPTKNNNKLKWKSKIIKQ